MTGMSEIEKERMDTQKIKRTLRDLISLKKKEYRDFTTEENGQLQFLIRLNTDATWDKYDNANTVGEIEDYISTHGTQLFRYLQYVRDDSFYREWCEVSGHSTTWFERWHQPNFHYTPPGQYRQSYWDYDLVLFCNNHQRTIFETGGRRNGSGGSQRDWFYKSGDETYSPDVFDKITAFVDIE